MQLELHRVNRLLSEGLISTHCAFFVETTKQSMKAHVFFETFLFILICKYSVPNILILRYFKAFRYIL